VAGEKVIKISLIMEKLNVYSFSDDKLATTLNNTCSRKLYINIFLLLYWFSVILTTLIVYGTREDLVFFLVFYTLLVSLCRWTDEDNKYSVYNCLAFFSLTSSAGIIICFLDVGITYQDSSGDLSILVRSLFVFTVSILTAFNFDKDVRLLIYTQKFKALTELPIIEFDNESASFNLDLLLQSHTGVIQLVAEEPRTIDFVLVAISLIVASVKTVIHVSTKVAMFRLELFSLAALVVVCVFKLYVTSQINTVVKHFGIANLKNGEPTIKKRRYWLRYIHVNESQVLVSLLSFFIANFILV
jgi:hypothetical protein